MSSPPTGTSAADRRRIGVAAAIWGISILLSRVIGLVREGTISRVLGGTSDADVYFVAFLVPDFLNYLLAGGALSIVFIPIFGAHLARRDEAGGWEAFSVIATPLLVVLVAATALLAAAMPWLAPIVGPGLDAEQMATLVTLSRIILPAQIFHLVGALLSATLQARDKHVLPALAPLVYNGCIVLGGLLGGSTLGAHGFAWGVLVGSVLGPFGLPLVGCLQTGMVWRPRLSPRHPDLRAYVIRSLPIMLGWSIVVVDDWLLNRQATLVAPGAVSTVHYAKTLLKAPIGVFGLATGVAAYPTLTRLLASGEAARAYETLALSVRRMLVLAFGAQVLLTVAGAEIAAIVLGGKVVPEQHAAIGLALAILSVSLWAWAAQTVVVRGFYATGNTWLPTILGTGTMLAAYPLYPWLGGIAGTEGLALASTIAITTYVVALMLLLRRKFPGAPDAYGVFFARAIASVAVSIGLGLGLATVLPFEAVVPRAVTLLAAGGGAYVVALWVMRVPEARDVARAIVHRLRRRATSSE